MEIITTVTELAQHAKYPLLFVIYIIEGPIANFISSVVAATGALNIYIVFALVLVAEVVMDWLFYYIGYKMHGTKIDKWLDGLEKHGIWKELKEIFSKNTLQALIIVKFVGGISVPGIIYLARIRAMSPKKYVFWAFILCLLKNGIISLLGYNFGIGLSKFMLIYDYYKMIGIAILVVIAFVIIFKAYEKQITEAFMKFIRKLK